jgi:hypothetical protein
MGVVSFTPWPLYYWVKSLRYPLDIRLSGPKSRFGRGGEEKECLPLPGIEPYHPARGLVTVLTELPRVPRRKFGLMARK